MVSPAIFFTNAGKITAKQSCIFALTEWANSCERKLCGISVGEVLPRDRHRKWAETRIRDAQFMVRRSGSGGVRGLLFFPIAGHFSSPLSQPFGAGAIKPDIHSDGSDA